MAENVEILSYANEIVLRRGRSRESAQIRLHFRSKQSSYQVRVTIWPKKSIIAELNDITAISVKSRLSAETN